MDLPPFRPMSASPGAQLAAADVVGRDAEISVIWASLRVASCLLNEPRRLGKTSVLVRMADGPAPPGWTLVHLSVQGVTTTAGLVACVLGAIRAHERTSTRVKDVVRNFLTDAEASVGVGSTSLTLRPSLAGDPLRSLDNALRSVSDRVAEDGGLLVIALDEFPDMVLSVQAGEGDEAARALLGVLRRLRAQHPARIRWLLTGSVGLHHVLRRLTSSGEQFVNDLDSVALGPLRSEWARWLASSLLLGLHPASDGAAAGEIARITDGIPYLIHLLVQQARQTGQRSLAPSDVEGLFVRAVGDLDASHQATHLLSRLGDYYGEDTDQAEWLLDHLAAEPAHREDLLGLDRPVADAALRALLDLLTRDHHIAKDESGRYAWRYEALRRIWVQRRA